MLAWLRKIWYCWLLGKHSFKDTSPVKPAWLVVSQCTRCPYEKVDIDDEELHNSNRPA